MKKLLIIPLSLVLAFISLLPLTAHAAATNLITNPSVETTNADGSPKAWKAEKWGTNTTSFQYLTDGHTGSRSLNVNMSGYTSGDAKWFFNPIAVTAGKKYSFSNYYQATASTEVVVRYTKSTGGFSYAALGNLPASLAWAPASYDFTVPPNMTKVTVFHLIHANGSLTIDDSSLTEKTDPQPPTGDNLIANPSFEAANGSTPESWTSNAWGTNATASTYASTGHTGNRSVKTEVSGFVDGDAKWYFEPVSVTAGKKYTFSDYYQASVTTKVTVRYTTAAGVSYVDLGNLAASNTWQKASFAFVVPAGVTKVTLFHLIATNGFLTMDDASLVMDTTNNPIPNPSVEQASATDINKPDQWNTNAWGSNTATFAYTNTGHAGNRGIKLTVSNYVDGDAKWYYAPQPLEKGKQYTFSAWYRTNTNPQVSAMVTLDDGTVTYKNLPVALPDSDSATQWQRYNETFTMPSNATAISIFFFLPGNGWIESDDYSISAYTPVGFNRPLVSLTFDDGFEENVSNVLPVLNQYNLKSTQCFATHFAEEAPSAIMAFKDAGHEICSHSVNHPFLTQLSDADLAYELSHSQAVLQTMTGSTVGNIASPFGDYNARVLTSIKQYYRSHRTVDEGYNSKDNFNIYKIRVQNVLSTTTATDVQRWLDTAKASNTWLVLVYHRVDTQNVGPFDSYVPDFNAQIQAVANSGLTVKTYNDALDELLPQL